VGEADLRVVRHLAVADAAAQLLDHLDHLCRPDAPIGSPLARQPPSVLIGRRGRRRSSASPVADAELSPVYAVRGCGESSSGCA
jgi:hypothetical protein